MDDYNRTKSFRQKKVDKRPKFVEIILKWRASNEEAVVFIENPHCFRE